MSAPILTVSPQEAGQKLLQFLQRRLSLDVPQSALMRWIRTGQVRVDKGRAKPFQRLEEGQEVRLPPQAAQELRAGLGAGVGAGESAPQNLPPVDILQQRDDLLVCAKPKGLPVHGGSGHEDSLQARLAAMFPPDHPEGGFAPTPAHRLDRDTSGLLLVALSYQRLRELQELFKEGRVRKEYLAWVSGHWPGNEVAELRDQVAKTGEKGCERVQTGAGKEALAWARCVTSRADTSLLLLRLATGRTHQLRVQLSARGRPIVGDRKYGGPGCAQGMLLHAFRLEIPAECFTLPAPWSGEFQAPEAIPELQPPPCVGETKESP